MLVDEHSGRNSGCVESIQKILDVVSELGQPSSDVFAVPVYNKKIINIFLHAPLQAPHAKEKPLLNILHTAAKKTRLFGSVHERYASSIFM